MSRLARWVLLMVFGSFFVGVSAAMAAPAPPALVGSVSNSGSLSGATSVAVSAGYAYTTSYWSGVLTAVDISDPANPLIAGSSAPATSLYDSSTVNVAGGYAFVASKNRNASTSSNDDGTGNSLTILDIQSNPAVPAVVGTLHDSANLFGAYGVAVSGSYAYVASQGLLGGQPTMPDTSAGSFSVISLSSLGSPAIVGHIDNATLSGSYANALEHVTSVAISGNYAYLTAFDSDRLTVIDISNPASPTIVASLHDSVNLATPADVAVSGDYAYVADQTGSSNTNLAVVDISNPLSPTVVGSVVPQSELSGAYRVRVSGNFAYISASGTATVAAIDISDPTHPRVAGYVTSTAELNATTGLDFDPNGGYIIASSPHLAASGSNPIYPPYPMTTGTISSIQLDPAPIAMTIAPSSEPSNPTAQTSASFSFAASDEVATVPQCQLDGAPFAACTSPTTQNYSSLGPGIHTFTVQTTDVLGNPGTASYTWTVEGAPAPPPPPIATPPANTTRPAVSGTAAIGQTLKCSQGSWTGTSPIVYAYSWTRDGKPVRGATRSTYLITSADASHRLACVVHATGFGSATASSASLPAPAGSGQIGRPKLLEGGAISVKVSCANVPGTVCRLSMNILSAIKATKAVVLASRSLLTLSAGKRETIKLVHDRAARKLLSTHHTLAAKLELTELGTNGQASIVSIQRLTLGSGSLDSSVEPGGSGGAVA